MPAEINKKPIIQSKYPIFRRRIEKTLIQHNKQQLPNPKTKKPSQTIQHKHQEKRRKCFR